ncbi:MAG: proton-conducting transporter membrane subunit, partial [Fimbriimonadaceae bacterium]
MAPRSRACLCLHLGAHFLGKDTFTISRPWWKTSASTSLFRLDGLSLLFWLLISGIGTLIFIYAAGYMKKDLGRLLSYLFLFMVAMLGLVSASDLITLFVFWEATSITSFLLIGFSHENPTARKSALQALLITGTGGLLLLAGFLILGNQNGTYNLAEITEYSQVEFWLILLGAMTKSAQFPFHFWLPNAMSAPTPVSAYLHSATMVKAGVFLLAKFSPLFGAQTPILVIGAITFVLASILSLFETDLKRILAWSTVGALGSMVMLIGIGTEKAALALAITILAHAAYKGALFMVAGIIDITAGTRDVTKLSGLGKHAPIL